MKFAAIFSLIAFTIVSVATAAEVAGPVAEPIIPREASPEPIAEVSGPIAEAIVAREASPEPIMGEVIPGFVKRECRASRCLCNRIQGQFCGNERINPYCLNSHVYECNAQTGHTCDYGYRNSCARCHRLVC
ncbi:hypothetical protein AX15_003789 [Amanita polypyramis BW_CC]|nr:hypothetical protein AX15_003789 [Amanita polypyramis BW_CC]